jgi:hypothetical protein
MTDTPPGFVLISNAVKRLENGMFGGLGRPDMVDRIKKACPRLSIGSGPQREKAAEAICQAVLSGKLQVYVERRGQARDSNSGADRIPTLRIVPSAVLKILPKTRGGLPDAAIRVPLFLLREKLVDEETFVALSSGPLLLKETDFASWYRREKRKGKWPSQRNRKSPHVGRPSKQDPTLINKVTSIVRANAWSGKVSELERLLARDGIVVSHDTVARILDALFVTTGDERFRRRSRRKAKLGIFHAKSD